MVFYISDVVKWVIYVYIYENVGGWAGEYRNGWRSQFEHNNILFLCEYPKEVCHLVDRATEAKNEIQQIYHC